MEETGEVAEILERYRVGQGFETFKEFEAAFNERLEHTDDKLGLSRQTFSDWRAGRNKTFNRALLWLVRFLHNPEDWRYQLATELLELPMTPE